MTDVFKYFLLLLIPSAFCYHYTNLSYQAHGFNDLDYFSQQLIKGTNFFKIDISPATRISCETHSTWNKTNNCEYFDGFEICCLGIRGDTSSIPIFRESFNNTDDLINMFNNSRFNFIWKKNNILSEYNTTKYIAINFQYNYPFSNLTKNFLYNLIRIINENELKIQIITGSDKFILDYEKKCMNLSNCDYMDLYIAKSNIILQSGSYSISNNRTKNFNVNFKDIQNYCTNGFPNWADDNNSLPYLFWEPSNEKDIKTVKTIFESNDCKKGNNHQNFNNVRITSNLEPEMLEVFKILIIFIFLTKIYEKKSNSSYNDFKIIIENSKNPVLEYDDKRNLIILSKIKNNINLLQFISFDDKNKFIVIKEITLENKINKLEKKLDYILMTSENSSYIYFLKNDLNLELIFYYKHTKSFLIDTLLETNKEVSLLVINRDLDFNYANFVIINIMNKQILSSFQHRILNFTSIPKINSLSISSILNTNKNIYEIILILSIEIDDYVTGLFGLPISIDGNYKLISIIIPENPFDFGTSPSVKLIKTKTGLINIFEVHTDGLCQSGLMMNNNEFGKCTFHLNEKHRYLLNTNNLMNYIWGKYDSFKDKINDKIVINGCDKNIMHAKFNNGKLPKGFVFYQGNQIQAFIANEYVDYDSLPLVTRIFCGGNINEELLEDKNEAIILQNFKILDEKIFEFI